MLCSGSVSPRVHSSVNTFWFLQSKTHSFPAGAVQQERGSEKAGSGLRRPGATPLLKSENNTSGVRNPVSIKLSIKVLEAKL